MLRNLYLLALVCLALVGIFSLTFTGRARGRADFIWNNATEPQTLDPNRMSALPEGSLALALFEGLTAYHPESLQPVPALARAVREDGLTYTFELREDAFWVKRGEIFRESDGSPRRVTAEDIIYSWKRHFLPEVGSEYSSLLHPIRGAREFEREVAEHWNGTVQRFREARGRAPVSPRDLGPALREEVERFRRERWEALVGIRAPSPFRLVVELRSPAPYFLSLTSFYPLMPVCREVVEEHGERWVLPENMVSNGPYYLEEWQFNSYIRLRKNRHHWETGEYARRRIEELSGSSSLTGLEQGELDLLRRHGSFVERGLEVIEALSVEELNTSLNLYLTGEIDYLREVPPELVRELILEGRRPGSRFHHMHHGPSQTIYYYSINTSLDVFRGEAGRKLRRALSLCVDRRTITERLARAMERPAYRLIPPGISGYPAAPLFGSGDFEADAREARRLVEEVRRERGPIPGLRILYNTHQGHEKIAAYIQGVWRERLGIEVDLSNQEWGVFLDSRRNGNYDLARSSWIADYPDPNTYLEIFTSGNQNNDTRYSSPLFDEIVQRACAGILEYLEQEDRVNRLLESIEKSPCFPDIRGRMLEGGVPLWEALRASIRSVADAPADEKLRRAFSTRYLLFQVAEEILLHDMPLIPIYVYTHAELWPRELEGMYGNHGGYHPPRFLRWRGGVRPGGTRFAQFPRFSPRERDPGG